MRHARLPACAVLLGLLLAVPSSAVNPRQPSPTPVAAGATDVGALADAITRGLRRVETGPRLEGRGRHRAVVIGVNYAGRDVKELGSLAPLKNAENDAEAVAKLLIDAFGYQPGDVRLITGAAATNAEVSRVLKNPHLGFDRNDPITKDDSVLVYFSGHGILQSERAGAPGAEHHGYLLPVDVKFEADKSMDRSTAIDLSDVVKKSLGSSECLARHKLLVLDCCHSGAVFRLQAGLATVRSDATRHSDDLFEQSSFQAMAATGTYQSASDGDKGNSPFTTNLLRAMATLGIRRHGTGQPLITASELFNEMKSYLANVPNYQSPEFRSLDGEGEFHFFVGREPKWPAAPGLSDEQRRVLMALTPSTFGYWWADEMPWFMPCLRMEILSSKQPDRSAGEHLDVSKIRAAAEAWVKKKGKDGGKAAEHLQLLLRTKPGREWDAAADKIISELRAVVETPDAPKSPAAAGAPTGERSRDKTGPTGLTLLIPPEPADYPTGLKIDAQKYALDAHFLAVLLHKRNRFVAADECYRSALHAYRRAVNPAGEKAVDRFMLALCRVDYGVLCLTALHNYGPAVEQFRDARQVAEMHFKDSKPAGDSATADGLVPFQVYALYREAEAHRRQGRFGRSDELLRDALSRMTMYDRAKASPMFAAVLKYYGWAYMDACRFDLAADMFKKSHDLFVGQSRDPADDLPSRIEAYHCRHGLAMIDRFRGEDEETVKGFRALTRDIAHAINGLDNSRTEVADYAGIRQRLIERYVNSLERQADCRLYGRRPDPVEAADDYRRAGLLVAEAAPERRDEKRLELQYRRIAALAVPVRLAGGVAGEPHDPELAAELYKEAEAAAAAFNRGRDRIGLPPRLELLRATAAFLVATPTGRADEVATFLTVLKHYPNSPPRPVGVVKTGEPRPDTPPDDAVVAPDRDELERLMFGYRVLIDHARRWDLSRFLVLECADRMLALCRAATAPVRLAGDTDYAFLKYLRHDYDAAFLVKAARTPVPVKELVEIAWEATRGEPYVKPAEVVPTLVLYRAAGQAYVLIDVPPLSAQQPAAAHCFRLSDEYSDSKVLDAATATGTLPLPPQVRDIIAAIKFPLVREQKDDRKPKVQWEVRWRDPVRKFGFAEYVTLREDAVPSGERFPFRLGDVLAADRFNDDADRRDLAGKSIRPDHRGAFGAGTLIPSTDLPSIPKANP